MAVDPFSDRAAMVPRAPQRPLSKKEKYALAGASALGVFALYMFWRKVHGTTAPSPTAGAPAAPRAPSAPSAPRVPAYHAPAAPAAPASSGDDDSAPVPPSQYTASYGDAPAGGGYYEVPWGG
jgi:hypothetical protein